MFNSDNAAETGLSTQLKEMVTSVATQDVSDAMEILSDPVALQHAV